MSSFIPNVYSIKLQVYQGGSLQLFEYQIAV